MHFTLRFMVYNNGLIGGNVCRLENFKFTCAHVQVFFFDISIFKLHFST